MILERDVYRCRVCGRGGTWPAGSRPPGAIFSCSSFGVRTVESPNPLPHLPFQEIIIGAPPGVPGAGGMAKALASEITLIIAIITQSLGN